MPYSRLITTSLILIMTASAIAAPPDTTVQPSTTAQLLTIDETTFIDANKIMMFISNVGIFGRDLANVFGQFYGTFYPYVDTSYISNGLMRHLSPLYGAGLWMGGKVEGNIRVVIAEYGSEYVPGPMVGETFCPDDPSFRVYKLYADSLRTNPNEDYLQWPFDQGAPADEYGRPLCYGDQTLWTVFNDADPVAHTNDAGETLPLGVEVQLLAFAQDDVGEYVIPGTDLIQVIQLGSTGCTAHVVINDEGLLTGHDYKIVVEDDETLGPVWHLRDETLGTLVLENRNLWNSANIDGLWVIVDGPFWHPFTSFQVVANADGPIVPPEPGALWLGDFPVPTEYDPDGYISDRQQVTYPGGQWGIHTADNGGSGLGTRCCFDAFEARVLRDGGNLLALGRYDYEMRFTGSYDNPGVNGSYAIEAFTGDNIFWVPFELWQIGIDTPEDPSDDVRLVPFITDDGNDDTYNLESYGTTLDGTCNADCEHSVSGDYNDPFTDWVYWIRPLNDAPGTAGYDAAEADMLSGDFRVNIDDHYGAEIMARTVLVSWNGGQQQPFVQSLPEQGTIFRILTANEYPPVADSFTFTGEAMPEITTGDEGTCVYLEYRVYNKGGNDLQDCYISLWSDPDLGYPSDDLVGCDTMNNICFCYNGFDYDGNYGSTPPATGFKFLVGPVVPSPGHTADVHGNTWPDHEAIGMTAFSKFFGSTGPDDYTETYSYMQGLTKSGTPYEWDGQVLTYMHSGDPVTATGDLDAIVADRRMLASCGPFDFPPGDSLYMLVRMAARHGADYLDAITELKRVLNRPFEITTDVVSTSSGELPKRFAVNQNYPNPFNPSTVIKYSLPERAQVTVDVFNILGQRVKRLVDQTQPAGEHSAVWNGTDEGGQSVASGFYFYRVKAGEKVDNKKMLLLK